MNFLLINPYIHDFTAYDLWAKPLGLLYIADLLKKNYHNIDFIDLLYSTHKNHPYGIGKYNTIEIEKPLVFKNIPRKYKQFGLSEKDFVEKLNEITPPDIIIVTSHMTYWYLGVFHTIKILKKFFPNTPLILGGIYTSLCNEHANKYSEVNYICKDTKLSSLIDIINYIKPKTIKNIIDIIELSPAYYLYESLDYIAINTSFGCPYKCTYCASKKLFPKFIERPLMLINKELYNYKNMHIKNIAFYDDALLINAKERIIPILKNIIKMKSPFNIHTPNGLHIRYISKEVSQIFKDANFKTIRLSFESHTSDILKASSFKTNIKEFEMAIKNLKNAGYNNKDIEVYILIGLPNQKEKDIITTMKIINNLGLKIKLAEFSPIPHTLEFKKASKLLPQIETEPLLHNSKAFTYLKKNPSNFNEIKLLAKELNDILI